MGEFLRTELARIAMAKSCRVCHSKISTPKGFIVNVQHGSMEFYCSLECFLNHNARVIEYHFRRIGARI